MDNYSGGGAPWYEDYHTAIKSIVIEAGVTSIGDYAFGWCTSLTSVTMQGSVKTIGYSAFIGCTGLGNMAVQTILDGVETIGDYAFDSCTVTSVTIPGSVTIGAGAFFDCTSLISVNILKGITSISDCAFSGCISLTSIVVPDSVITIGLGAFQDCTSLESIVVPDSVTTIKEQAFSNCSGLTSIVIPDKVTFSVNYDDYVFDSCTSLTSVTVTGGLVSGGETIPNGVIDMYFRSGLDDDVNWKLGYGVNVTTLFLPDIVSLDYDPNNEDGKGGIAGAEGRVLSYKDAEYICSGTSDWELVACSLFGTVKDTDGNPVSGATVILELNSGTYSALTGIDGGYMISGIPAGTYGTITASKIGYYLTDSVSVLPLTESVRTDMAVTASERLTEYYVSFGFGSDCTAYVNGSPVSSSPIGVTGGGSLSFTVQTPEGYSAVPAVSGMADLLKQSDGSYVIRNIYSNLSVTVTVSADIRSGPDVNPGDSSGNGSDNGSGNDSSGNGSGGDSSDGIPYWVPVLIAGAFIVCIAAVLIVRRSRNRQ